jgi:hypothetical protein
MERLNCGMRLERALGAFDMFMLHDNEGDLDEVRFTEHFLWHSEETDWVLTDLRASR